MKHQGDKIAFRLDGVRYGEGTVVSTVVTKGLKNNYNVRLTIPCKEFKTGETIIVSEDEISENTSCFYSVLRVVNETTDESYIVVCSTKEDDESISRLCNNSNMRVTNISTPENSDGGIYLNHFPV
jgi:hypothetical protein